MVTQTRAPMNLSEPVQPSGPMPAIGGQTLRPGDVLEDFEILQVLGLTSFGVLYLARNQTDGSTVAVKEYMPSSIAARRADGRVEPISEEQAPAFDRGLQAFLTEALTLSQFDHPNLLRVSSIWECNGTAYRSMPYLAGTTLLARRASTREPLGQAQLQTLVDGLLGALLTLYHAGLAHGQVEPVNIYLLEDGQPVLMDFDAVHQAVLSDLHQPYLDAYADPSKTQALVSADLHAVAAVLHFAISNDWAPARARQMRRYPPLADVLLRFKDSASVLEYQPEFLAAIDNLLARPAVERPGTITEFRAEFESKLNLSPSTPAPPSDPAAAPAAPAVETEKTPARRPKREPIASAPPAFPLNSNESVLALLANFDRGPAQAAEDVEPFQSPEVPTLTEEAEPTHPPLRPNPFDDMEEAEAEASLEPPPLMSYTPLGYTPMPRIPRNPWRRRMVAAGLAAVVVAGVGTLAWQLFS
jgi:serine/threonine protein kinase